MQCCSTTIHVRRQPRAPANTMMGLGLLAAVMCSLPPRRHFRPARRFRPSARSVPLVPCDRYQEQVSQVDPQDRPRQDVFWQVHFLRLLPFRTTCR
jgi:hypothetical protein